MPPTDPITVDDIALGDYLFWAKPLTERAATFARLRDACPVSFHKELAVAEGVTPGAGFWSVVNHDDLKRVSRLTSTFSSAKGITVGDELPEAVEFFGSMIVMDDPRHAKFRMLVQKGFTPKMVAQVEQNVRVRARRLVSAAAEMGECDFVQQFAAPLPLLVICDMLGIPESDVKQIFDWTNIILGVGDPEFGMDLNALLGAAMGMFSYAQELGQARLNDPKDDITSSLMHAEVDGQRLTTAEFGSFFILLAVAGNETTRNAISWGAKLLTDNPEQKQLWMADPAARTANAVEEIVRWASPVIHMRRTATQDFDLHGEHISEGDKVVMWYWAANRDERVFADPNRFDITRANARDQLGFGAGGPHFCLGANLARREISVMFEELFQWLPDLRITSEPDRLLSPFINGIKRQRCEFTPASVPASL